LCWGVFAPIRTKKFQEKVLFFLTLLVFLTHSGVSNLEKHLDEAKEEETILALDIL